MATVVKALDTVTAWVQANICDKIKLKMPPLDENEATDAGYDYKLITPHAFAFFVPTQDKLPPNVLSPMPSVCVRITDGESNLVSNENALSFELYFSTWSTGEHGEDVFNPVSRENVEQWTGAEADAHFLKNGDGWRDAWNMIDTALLALGSTTNIDGLEIDRSVPVKFSPLKEQEAIPDYYPFWFASLSFGIKQPIQSHIADIQNLL